MAVLSLNGVVCRASVRLAGRKLDEAIVKYVRNHFGLLIGQRMAERAKIDCASVSFLPSEDCQTEIKGGICAPACRGGHPDARRALRGTLRFGDGHRVDGAPHSGNHAARAFGDIHRNGLLMTGGGSLLHGFDRLLINETGLPVRVAENPTECVAKGTARAFEFLDSLSDGFVRSPTFPH